MNITPTNILDCNVIDLDKHDDERGFFQELFNSRNYGRMNHPWVQFNQSVSKLNVIRGIHIAPFAKLVSCTAGKIFDVVVDMRPDSDTFKQWFGIELDHTKQVYVPAGCGHGFMVLSCATVVYLQSDFYDPTKEKSLNFQDPEIGIQWPKPIHRVGADVKYVLSERDRTAPNLG